MVNHATILGPAVSSKEQRERQKQQEKQYLEMDVYNDLNDVERQMKDSLERKAGRKAQNPSCRLPAPPSFSSSSPSSPSLSIGARYKAEVCSDPFSTTDATGRLVDIHRTFRPQPFWLAFGFKTILVIWAWSLVVTGLLEYRPVWFYFAYLTHWSLVVSCVYLTLSWIVTVLPPPELPATTNNGLSLWMYLTWFVYTVAAPAEILVPVLYWTLEFDWTDEDQEITYQNLGVHGFIGVMLLFEGLVVNRIPIRVSQQWFFILYTIAFMAWTLFHAFTGIGNPTTPADDDTLYAQLDWIGSPFSTGAVAAGSIFLVAPLSFHLLWMLSLYSCPCSCEGKNRRYITSSSSNTATKYTPSTTCTASSSAGGDGGGMRESLMAIQ